MRSKWLILLCVILCFVLSACGAETPPSTDVNESAETAEPNTDEVTETPEPNTDGEIALLPAREDVLAVGVGVAGLGTVSYNYMGTNESEKEAVLDLLYKADLSSFEVPEELTGAGGLASSYLLQTADETIEVEIRTDIDVQWLLISSAGQKNVMKGPEDVFDPKALDELNTQIRINTEDPLHCGCVEFVDSGDTQKLNKAQTANSRGQLDSVLAKAEIAADESISYDVLFTVGELTYGLNTETGHFYRQMDGEKAYAQLEEYPLKQAKSNLNLPPQK